MTLDQVIEYFNKIIAEGEIYRFVARSSKLQIEQCRKLDVLQYNARQIKLDAIDRADEDLANLFLGYVCVIGSLRSELLMYIELKRDRPQSAWDQLIASQMGCADAIRAHGGFAHCQQRLDDLEALETTLFPPQVFMSAGFIAERLDCSICGDRYSDCEHLRGRPYMGRFCEVIHRNPQGDHAAIVDRPADKRCRLLSFKTKDGHQNKLSWEKTPFKDDEHFDEDGPLETHSILMVFERYPYLKSTSEVLEAFEDGDAYGTKGDRKHGSPFRRRGQ